MQAVCDSNCIFKVVSCRFVGSTNDGVAFSCSSLSKICSSLPFPFHWVGDAAYGLSKTMIVPFEGINLHVICIPKDWFNFWQSQVSIIIERTFGIFVARWGVFWKPLNFSLVHTVAIIQACCRLHNFSIARKIPVRDDTERRATPAIARLDDNGRLVDDDWRDVVQPEAFAGRTGSTYRDYLLEIVERKWLRAQSQHYMKFLSLSFNLIQHIIS